MGSMRKLPGQRGTLGDTNGNGQAIGSAEGASNGNGFHEVSAGNGFHTAGNGSHPPASDAPAGPLERAGERAAARWIAGSERFGEGSRAGTALPQDEAASEDAPVLGPRAYSIRVASRLTGIPADTLRMWERRYGFPRPERTGGGSRTYTDEDIEVLHLLSRAMKAGYRPGEIVGKTRAELEDILAQVAPARAEPLIEGALPTVRGLVQHLLADDTQALASEMRRAALRLGPRRFVTDLAHPFTVEVGTLWEAGKIEVRHEHLASEVLSTLLRLLLSTSEDGLGRPIVLLATLPGEQHGLGLEMVALHVAARRATPRLLGVNTPRDQIVKAARALSADVVGLTITPSSDVIAAAADIRWMLSELPRRVEIWAGGEAATRLALSDPGLKIVTTFSALDAALEALGTG
ncbi:MAG: MerR family transcriptional regulator [Polyangiaceae bacterium]